MIDRVEVYLALTRPTKKMGVSYEAFMGSLFGVFMSMYLALGLYTNGASCWWYALLLGPALYVMCYMIESGGDDRAFRVLFLWFQTGGVCSLLSYRYWKAATFSPFPRRRY